MVVCFVYADFMCHRRRRRRRRHHHLYNILTTVALSRERYSGILHSQVCEA